MYSNAAVVAVSGTAESFTGPCESFFEEFKSSVLTFRHWLVTAPFRANSTLLS